MELRRVLSINLMAALVFAGMTTGLTAEAGWTKANESSLRKLIAEENVVLETYYSELDFDGIKISWPLHRLRVPERFVEIYRTHPVACLKVLVVIIENGSTHDAWVVFQFGYAGDKRQIALPPFAYFPSKDLDKTDGDRETRRQCCLRIINDLIVDLTNRSQSIQR